MPMLTRSAGARHEPPDVRGADEVAPFLASAQELTPTRFNLVKRLLIEVARLDEAGQHAEARRLIDELRAELFAAE